jgi:hypothetical protein
MMYLKTPYKIYYDTDKFPFRETVERMLETQNLEKLHTEQKYDVVTREQDQKTHWHRMYYDRFQKDFQDLYRNLVVHLAQKFGYSSLVYQKIPTFRVQLVGNLSVGEWHKDRSYNHGISEVNFWMPFTDAYGSNTVWCESQEDLGDYRPYKVNYGEILVFDGANLTHGNQINTTEDTRVSVDFRLVDPEKFVENSGKSINGITSFTLGGYFEKISLE